MAGKTAAEERRETLLDGVRLLLSETRASPGELRKALEEAFPEKKGTAKAVRSLPPELRAACDRLRRTREAASAMADKLGLDDLQGDVGRMLAELVRAFMWKVLSGIEDDPASLDSQELSRLTRCIKDLVQISRLEKDFERKARDEASRNERERAAAVAGGAARAGGLSAELVERIKADILGVQPAVGEKRDEE